MLRVFAAALIFAFFSSLGLAQTQSEIAPKFRSEFKRILVDVRNSRFGAGDVAASYLTITDLIKTYKVDEKISLLTNETSAKILRRLAHGNQEFFDHVNIYNLKTLPPNDSFDLYLSFANSNGKFQNEVDFRESNAQRAIHLEPDAILITQTVLGNTENKLFHLHHASLRFHEKDYNLSVPGLGAGEAGVYDDFIAKQLRGQSAEEVNRFLTDHLTLVDDKFSNQALYGVIDGTKLKGAKVGLAYGLSSKETQQPQFLTYLKGLAAQSDQSFCLIAPASVDPQSGFTQASVTDPVLMEKLVFVNTIEAMPAQAQPGKIYIVRTQNLPHSLFVGLMARTMKEGLVPVGAGDGFLSAALNLGGPFVLTQVRWNAKNVANFKALLLEAAKNKFKNSEHLPQTLELIEEIFGRIDFTHAQNLRELSSLFEEVGRSTPGFTERIVNAAFLMRHLATAQPSDFLDPLLRESIAAHANEKEEPILTAKPVTCEKAAR